MIKLIPIQNEVVITCITETLFKIYVLWSGAARVQIRLVYMYLSNVPSVSSRYFNNISFNNNIIWASTRENCLRGFAINTGADQPAHPRSLISAFVVRCFESIICGYDSDDL